ncbi:putative Histone acetyltransferase type B catalytic subunit [Hypsibius exemplaris]|uniref:histone acetyltransferase n=1 Tax=Hypsibius exemplaris TaxID=2072580 RepID=A0A1W0X1Z9_HYPEX|nr:putative Histone acetyltransferase type B catalytic subunit [Hypsibius exemplaris]
MDPANNSKKRVNEEPTTNGNGVFKKVNGTNGNSISHQETPEAEHNGRGTNGVEQVKSMTAAELLEIPTEFRANGLKVVTFRVVDNEQGLLTASESSAAPAPGEFNPLFVYQYFKEPGDEEAEAEAAAARSALLASDHEGTAVKNAANDSDNSEAEEEDEEEGMDGRIVLPDENEGVIAGYKDLKVTVLLTAATWKPFVAVSYSEALPPGQRSVTDIVQAVEKVYGHKVMTTNDAMLQAIKDDAKFVPIGRKVNGFTTTDKSNTEHAYEVYEVGKESQDLGYPARFSEYLALIQPVLQWFIYASRIVTTDDSHWLHYFLYQKTNDGSVRLIGYCSVYRFKMWPRKSAADAPAQWVGDHLHRCRIAQFLVLPPYQKSGLGARMLRSIITRLQEDSNTYEITLEDASPDCQNLFDVVTAFLVREHLSSQKTMTIDYKKPLPAEQITQIRQKLKLAPSVIKFAFDVLACSTARRQGREAIQDYYENLTVATQQKIEDAIGGLERTWQRIKEGYYDFSEDNTDNLRKIARAGWRANYIDQKDKQERQITPEKIGRSVEKQAERTNYAVKRIEDIF